MAADSGCCFRGTSISSRHCQSGLDAAAERADTAVSE